MGNRERWVDDKEVEANGQLAAIALKTIRATPGALVSGKAPPSKYRVCCLQGCCVTRDQGTHGRENGNTLEDGDR